MVKKPSYDQLFSTLKVEQPDPIPGREQRMKKGDAGGYVFKIDNWTLLNRFLVLGSDTPTFYVNAKTLTQRNAHAVMECIKEDGIRTIDHITEVSHARRAPRNDPALFALAMCAGTGDLRTRQKAFRVWGDGTVARTGTHLFHLNKFADAFMGWGRGRRRANARWYNEKSPDALAYQLLKYRQRDGWSHRDILRLSHVKARDAEHEALYRWVIAGAEGLGVRTVTRQLRDGRAVTRQYDAINTNLPRLIEGFVRLQEPGLTNTEAANIIRDYGLTREMVPTRFLDSPMVWEALLDRMPMEAMLRNLGKMTNVGLLAPMSGAARLVSARLRNSEAVRKSGLHPLAILVALKIYAQGHGMRGRLSWTPVAQVIDALDSGFYIAFGNVEPIGKPVILAVDASGSMACPLIGLPLTCREAAVAMALVTAKTESDYVILGFTARGHVVELPITPRQRLDDAMRTLNRVIEPRNTDCSLPIRWAIDRRAEVDGIIVLTDNETWVGFHPVLVMEEYRHKVAPAKMVSVGMVANDVSIADPKCTFMLDVAGFDTATPGLVSSFIRGEF